ncbi:MAG: KpsF/GutQ family sugar-phosphate isomerase [Bacteroidota bacterium]
MALSIVEKGKEVVRIELCAIASLEDRINEQFEHAVKMIGSSTGHVIVTGMGKSGLIARKIVATMNSTGTPAIFVHPTDAIHGDLGIVSKDDVVIMISKSGETEELYQLIPLFKRIGTRLIAMVGNPNSRLGRNAEIVLDISVKEEACPHNLAPTSSTTATLVMGDALAVALLEQRNFTKEDFAMFHPGGNLGKRLLLKTEEIMIKGDGIPIVKPSVSFKDAIIVMTSKRLGATCVVNEDGSLAGIITDGDLRRLLQKTTDVGSLTAEQIMTKNPHTITADMLAAVALQEMEQYNITQLVVVDDQHKPIGVVHLHDLVKAGLSNDNSF